MSFGRVKTSPEGLIRKAESMNLGLWSSSESRSGVHARFVEDSEWNTILERRREFQSIADVLARRFISGLGWEGSTEKPCEVRHI